MENIQGIEKQILTKDQISYYKQKTKEAREYNNQYTKHTPKDKEFNIQELKKLQAKLYHINENNKEAQNLLLEDMRKDIELLT